MAISLNTNVSSLETQNRLRSIVALRTATSERLSTGLRINRASDDASGLAIAKSLDYDARVFSKAIKNVNDGISLFNVAEGALSQLTSIAIRQTELAEQAANGVLSSAQRSALDEEANALVNEFNRIVEDTNFNGRKLIDYSLTNLSIQAGFGTDGTLSFSLGSDLARNVGDGTFSQASSFQSGVTEFAIASGDVNGDGNADLLVAELINDTLNVHLGNGDGTFGAFTSFQVSTNPNAITLSDFNGDGFNDIAVSADSDDKVSILLGNGDGTFQSQTSYGVGDRPQDLRATDVNNDGILDIVTSNFGTQNISVLLGNSDGTFGASNSFSAGAVPRSIDVGDFNGDGNIDFVTPLVGGSFGEAGPIRQWRWNV